jgi:hypothetical protein
LRVLKGRVLPAQALQGVDQSNRVLTLLGAQQRLGLEEAGPMPAKALAEAALTVLSSNPNAHPMHPFKISTAP